MKKLIALIFSVAITAQTIAQEGQTEQIVVPLTKPGERGRLLIDQINGDIILEGYTGQEVIIQLASKGKNDNKEENQAEGKENGRKTPEGFKKVGGQSFELSATEKDNVVKVTSESWKGRIDLAVKVPKNFDLELSTVHGKINITNVDGAIEVSGVNGSISLTNVNGSALCNTVNGGITALMKGVTSGEPMSFVTLNGDVDVTLPASVKAAIKMQSDRGEIFTDFDMAMEKPATEVSKESGEYRVAINSWVRGKINGGGPEYTFKNMNGNIIIRKGE